jgi:hypothetical protein
MRKNFGSFSKPPASGVVFASFRQTNNDKSAANPYTSQNGRNLEFAFPSAGFCESNCAPQRRCFSGIPAKNVETVLAQTGSGA